MDSRAFKGLGKIYSLSDKEGNVFYVGCTILSMDVRLSAHISEAKRGYGNSQKNDLIKALNYEIVATILETKKVKADNPYSAVSQLFSAEKKWVAKYIKMGCSLYNKSANKVINTLSQNSAGQTFSSTGNKITKNTLTF